MGGLDFRNLQEVELDRGFAAEDRDQDFDLALGFINRANGTKQVGEWPLDDLDGFADGESGLELGRGLLRKGENGVDFFLGNWGGVVAGADEAGDALSCPDREPGVVGDDHLDEHVAREDLFLDGTFFAFADFDFVLSGNEDLVDVVGQAHGLNLGP